MTRVFIPAPGASMTGFGFLLVLSAAFCHATWNYFIKKINGGPELIWLFSVIALALYAPLAIWIAVSQDFAFDPWSLFLIGGSVALHLGYFLLLQLGYGKGDLSLVYPVARATGPLLSTSFAVALLGERPSVQLLVGAAIIIIGVLLLTGGLRRRTGGAAPSLMFGVGAGTLIGGYTVWDAYTVAAALVPPILLDYASALGRSVLLAPVAYRRRRKVAEHWRRHRTGVLLVAVFNPLAYILVLYALTFTPVAYVAPTREVSVVLTVLAGAILLGEGDLARRLAWSAFIVLGVALLATA